MLRLSNILKIICTCYLRRYGGTIGRDPCETIRDKDQNVSSWQTPADGPRSQEALLLLGSLA